MRHERAAQEEDAREVRVENLVPLGEGEVRDGLADVDARVVDEDGQLAEARQHILPQLLHLRLARHVHLIHLRLRPAVAAGGLNFREELRVAGDEGEPRARVGEGESHRLAQALARAGDEGGLAGEFFISAHEAGRMLGKSR